MRIINRCPHTRIIGIYGDEANHGFRLRCADCGRLLDGPAKLANYRQETQND